MLNVKSLYTAQSYTSISLTFVSFFMFVRWTSVKSEVLLLGSFLRLHLKAEKP